MISDMINQYQRRQHVECAFQNLVIKIVCYICYDIKLITLRRPKQEETCLWEESGKAVIVVGGVGGQSAIRHKSVFQAVEIPTGVAHLNSCLRIIVILTDVSSSDDRLTWPMWTERHSLILLYRIEISRKEVWDGAYQGASWGDAYQGASLNLKFSSSALRSSPSWMSILATFLLTRQPFLQNNDVDPSLNLNVFVWPRYINNFTLLLPSATFQNAKPISGKQLGIIGFVNYVG